MAITREQAWKLLNEYVQTALIKHCLAVEAAMRAYAKKYGADEELWGITGLLHDMDYEKFPDKHPFHGVEILKSLNYPDEISQGIAELGVPKDEHIALVIKAMQGIAPQLGF